MKEFVVQSLVKPSSSTPALRLTITPKGHAVRALNVGSSLVSFALVIASSVGLLAIPHSGEAYAAEEGRGGIPDFPIPPVGTRWGAWALNQSLENKERADTSLRVAQEPEFGPGASGQDGDYALEMKAGGKAYTPPVAPPLADYSATFYFKPDAIPEGRCVVATLLGAGTRAPMAVVGMQDQHWMAGVLKRDGSVDWLVSAAENVNTRRFHNLQLSVISKPTTSQLFRFHELMQQSIVIPGERFDGQMTFGAIQFGGVSYPGCTGRLDDVAVWSGVAPAAGHDS